MALIKCPECTKEVSDKAVSCINCGYPLHSLKKLEEQTPDIEEPKTKQPIKVEKTKDIEDLLKKGDVLIDLKEYQKAESAFNNAIEIAPQDWRCWFGLVKVHTKSFSDLKDKRHLTFLEKAKKVANVLDNKEIDKFYKNYTDKIIAEKEKTDLERNNAKIKRNKTSKKIAIWLSVACLVIAAIITPIIYSLNPKPPKIYTITLDTRGGTCSQTSIQSDDYPPIPTHSQYVFDRWYTSTNWITQGDSNWRASIKSDATLYARWAKEEKINLNNDNWKNYFSIEYKAISIYEPHRVYATLKLNDLKYDQITSLEIISVTFGSNTTFTARLSTSVPSATTIIGTGNSVTAVSGQIGLYTFEKSGGGW